MEYVFMLGTDMFLFESYVFLIGSDMFPLGNIILLYIWRSA